MTTKSIPKLVKAALKEKFKDEPTQQIEYQRAIQWRSVFAERGFKLTNRFIPDTFVKPGER